MLASALLTRECGEYMPSRFAEAVTHARTESLVAPADAASHVPQHELVAISHNAAPILTIDVEGADERYLLAADSRAYVYLYDLSDADDGLASDDLADGTGGVGAAASDGGTRRSLPADPIAEFYHRGGARGPWIAKRQAAIAAVGYDPTTGRTAVGSSGGASSSSSSSSGGGGGPAVSIPGHNRSISSVRWYQGDTGMFITGGYDSRVLAWDTGTFTPAFGWTLDGRVYATDVSRVATTHALVAAGTDDSRVRLIDLATCGFTHTLVGHTGPVMTVAWAPSHEYVLATGSRDGTLRLWDVRRSGSTAQLDVFDMTKRRAPGGTGITGGAAASAGVGANPSYGYTASAAVAHPTGVTSLLWLDPPVPPAATTVGGGALSRRAVAPGGVAASMPTRPAGVAAPLSTCGLLSAGLDHRVRRWHVETALPPPQPPSDATAAVAAAGATVSAHAASLLSAAATLAAADPLTVEHVKATGICEPVAFPVLPFAPRHAITMAAARLSRDATGTDYAIFVPTTRSPMVGGGGGGGGAAAASSSGGGSGPGSIVVVDNSSGTAIKELAGAHHAAVNAVCFLPSQQVLMSAGEDGAIMRWHGPFLRRAAEGRLAGDGEEGLPAVTGTEWLHD